MNRKKDIPVGNSASKEYNLVILDCPLRRSLIATVNHCQTEKDATYENRKWKVTYLFSDSGNHYDVIHKKTGAQIYVIYYRSSVANPRDFGYGAYISSAQYEILTDNKRKI